MNDVKRDEQLARLLGEMTEQRRRGQNIDPEAVARQHPDLADELSSLWTAVQLVERFAVPISIHIGLAQSQGSPSQQATVKPVAVNANIPGPGTANCHIRALKQLSNPLRPAKAAHPC